MVARSEDNATSEPAERSSWSAVVVDGEGKLIFVSHQFEETFGYESSLLLGQFPPYPWWPPEGAKVLTELHALLRSHETWRGTVRGLILNLVRANGRRIEVSSRCRSIDAAGETLFVLSFESDANSEYERLHNIADRLDHAVAAMDPNAESDRDPWHCSAPGAEFNTLSARQLEVVKLLVQGLRPAAIACTLSISAHTVRNHTKAIFAKLGVHSQLELVHSFGVAERKHSNDP